MPKKFFPYLEEESTDVNMTPLLDVLFVLLILFILIAPLLKIERVQLVTSKEEAKNVKAANFETKSHLVIEVDKNNLIYINNEKVKPEEFLSRVQNLKLEKSTIPILLQDKKSEFGTFENIKQSLESLDFKQIDVVLN